MGSTSPALAAAGGALVTGASAAAVSATARVDAGVTAAPAVLSEDAAAAYARSGIVPASEPLKRAAMARMVTLERKLNVVIAYPLDEFCSRCPFV
jgi:hypothetical protein